MNKALMLSTLVLLGACRDEDASCVDQHPSGQGPSMPCCVEYGKDACGAQLFCAALDGRTEPTCYAEGSRLRGQECTENLQCFSQACDPDRRQCLSVTAEECTADVGCADRDDVCLGNCQPIRPPVSLLNACNQTEECDGAPGVICSRNRCRSVSACSQHADCASHICGFGCQPCANDTDCRATSGPFSSCKQGNCIRPCQRKSDCEGYEWCKIRADQTVGECV